MCPCNCGSVFSCSISLKGEELTWGSLPASDSIIKINTDRVSASDCTVSCLLKSKQSLLSLSVLISSTTFALLHCTIASSPSLRIITCPVPSESHASPCGMLYSSSTNSTWLLFQSGEFIHYLIQPDLESGSYQLVKKRSIPLLDAPAPSPKRRRTSTTPDPCLTSLSDRCFVYVTSSEQGATLHFTDLDYLAELLTLSLPAAPSALSRHASSLFLLQRRAVSRLTFRLSSLSLAAILTSAASPLALASHGLLVDSSVHTQRDLTGGLAPGLLSAEEWKQRSLPSSAGEEETALLQAEDFHAAALAFVAKRREENESIVSLDLRFVVRMIDRCLLEDGRVLADVVRELILAGVDVSVNPRLLRALLKTEDLETVLLFLIRTPVIAANDLLTILTYCIKLDPAVVQRFAEANEWELRDPQQTKRVFLGLVGPQVVRIRCDLGSLRQCFAQLTIDEVFEVGVLLCEMLVNLDKPSKEEEMLFKKYEKEQARLYAGTLVEWINSLVDANMMRMVMETKTDDRFVKWGRGEVVT